MTHKAKLTRVYDCINRIARKHEQQGRDRSDWFYTGDQFNALKSDSRNRFL